MSDPLDPTGAGLGRRTGRPKWSDMTPEQKKVVADKAKAKYKEKQEFAKLRELAIIRGPNGVKISFIGGAWTPEMVAALSRDFYSASVKG